MAQGAASLPGEGEVLHVLGDTITVKIDRDATDGRFAVIEEVTPPGAGIPPHVHDETDETFAVLEGEAEYLCGERTVRAPAGTVVFVPRGVPHGFRNVGTTPLKQQVTLSPPAFVDFFRAVDRLSAAGPPAMDEVLAVAEEHDVRFL